MASNNGEQHVYKIKQEKRMFSKILIANRGEIACRIIKTARSSTYFSTST